jgi:signal transduction histidine kinase
MTGARPRQRRLTEPSLLEARLSDRARALQLEAAEHRVVEQLRLTAAAPASRRRLLVVLTAAVLFGLTFAARLLIHDPDALLANFYVVPVILLAAEFGTRGGVLAATFALGLVFAWSAIETIHVGALGYVSREAVLVIAGAVVGRFSERLREDIAQRRSAQRHLGLYADQLERANHHLVRSVERLEAIGEIARAVGDETDLERVLSLVLTHAREIVAAETVVVYLLEGSELVAVATDGLPGDLRRRVPATGSLLGEVLNGGGARRATGDAPGSGLPRLRPHTRTAIFAPLAVRGEIVGVLAGLDRADGQPFEADDEELLMSVAASAATAVTTVRSVAAARLRVSLEASEQARARWARELHDETLQGLTGARMVLSAGLARDQLGPLRAAAQTADSHLGEEIRKLRELIAELRPAALDDLGLGPAIESLAKRQATIGSFSMAVELDLDGRERLGRDTENAIYRIVQEALNNAVKHAGARSVRLRVRALPDRVRISVEDDGCGFDPARAPAGFGITGMRERALLEGGELTVTSTVGGPTAVTAVLPLPV